MRILLVLLPSLVMGLIVAACSVAVAAGIFWLFIYGDNTWPEVASTSLMVLFVLVFVTSTAGMVRSIYAYVDTTGVSNRRLAALCLGATVMLGLGVYVYEWQRGNLAGPSPCQAQCLERGYSASGAEVGEDGQVRCRCF